MKSGPLVVGLLGGVGSGKSTVARAFARHGAKILDADRMAHAVLERPDIRRRLVRRWGARILRGDGRVNRAALAARAFDSTRSVRALNGIVHPAVRRALREEICKARKKSRMRTPSSKQRRHPPIVVDAPLLMEAGAHTLCDALVFVSAPLRTRRQRVRRRSGWSPAELARRERFQISLPRKRSQARFTIDNADGQRRIGPQVRSILAQLEAM